MKIRGLAPNANSLPMRPATFLWRWLLRRMVLPPRASLESDRVSSPPLASPSPPHPASARPSPLCATAAYDFSVPETLLKKQRRDEELRAKRVQLALAAKKRAKTNRQKALRSAEKYVKEYRSMENQLVRMRREAKAHGNMFVEPESKLVFAIRIRGIMGVSPKVRKVLQLLRLRQLHNGVFIKMNKASLHMLRMVEPYVAYGVPNLKSVRELLYKRGFAKVNRQRVPITDNTVIEKTLGKQGLICIEDLVHEIYTVGPHFKEANNFLWPFKLTSPRGGFTKKLIHFNEGGEAGNREQKINALIQKML
eukprot:CAMPEP_0196778346 /NCGR_PEP_ID=MMETSP1104-20130614/5737_1 /TAXON_ID=33652 /ORGANISM="Cafeteria sp., Strain Caron Lab Isolate" /LENGTH=307 /DNA_ID=CAMNT_0042148515 /DNA_START=356 /DNA_END=1279 /DNA_ORIENTATION=-